MREWVSSSSLHSRNAPKKARTAHFNSSILTVHVSDGSTAVHRACHDGQHEALQLLIEYHADLAIHDMHGRCPIHWACAAADRQCLRVSAGLYLCLSDSILIGADLGRAIGVRPVVITHKIYRPSFLWLPKRTGLNPLRLHITHRSGSTPAPSLNSLLSVGVCHCVLN